MSDPSAYRETTYLVVDSPHEVARWRPLFNWVLYIPHGIISGALRSLANLLFVIYWLIMVFTGRLNTGLYGLIAMYERYSSRTGGFLMGYSETYPPFDFADGPQDNGAYPPVVLQLPEVPADAPRSAALNVLKAIPHFLLVVVIGFGAFFVAAYGWFAVLFTGSWPVRARAFLVRFANYYYRVWTYVVMVDSRYPRFGLPSS